MQAEYDTALTASGRNSAPAMRQRCDRLARFVEQYPNATQTPDAMLELAALYEANRHQEAARASYLSFVERFPRHAQALNAPHAARWLELTGRSEFLVLPRLFTEDERLGMQFDVGELRGHVVLVYFWESR